MRLFLATLLIIAAVSSLAQTPVEDVRQRQDVLLHGQQKAGLAYRELQQAEFAATQAEQDYRQADADYKTAQKRADEFKRLADAAKKNLDAAKAKEDTARKSYDAAVNAVDQSWRKPAPK
jgi:ABC-type transport system involved in cytochrome bd biosynthesis fused ATPase/permease subunit